MSRATINTGGVPLTGRATRVTSETATDRPCHILILADFSGREHRGLEDATTLRQRKIVEVTPDNIDTVFQRLHVTLDTAIADGPIEFNEPDDLHPDFIYERVDTFARFRGLKRRLSNNQTFDDAAREVMSWSSTAPVIPEPVTGKQGAAESDLLESLLHSTRAQAESKQSIHGLIQQIIAPYVLPGPDPRQADLLNAVDQAAGHLMRSILHNSAFQSIESNWRGLQWLLKQLETDSQLRIFVADITLVEIATDNENNQESLTDLHQLLIEQRIGQGGMPFGVMVAAYQFSDQLQHCDALANLASVAADSHAVLVTGGSERLAGCDSLLQQPDPDNWKSKPMDSDFELLWDAIRNEDYSQHVMMTVPRFLLRLPYGQKTSPIESLEFEELPETESHQYYLWGNGAWLIAAQIGKTYSAHGWQTPANWVPQLANLPLHVFREMGESRVTPCAEVHMLDRTATALQKAGLTVIRSMRDQDSVLIPAFRSLHPLLADCIGPWSETA